MLVIFQRWKKIAHMYNVPWVRLLRTKNEKSKDYCKATAKLIQKNVHCFFITIFRLTIPAFFSLLHPKKAGMASRNIDMKKQYTFF